MGVGKVVLSRVGVCVTNYNNYVTKIHVDFCPTPVRLDMLPLCLLPVLPSLLLLLADQTLWFRLLYVLFLRQ